MFQVGDFIIGNENNTGIFTGVGSTCKVTRVFEFTLVGLYYDMEIYVIKGNSPGKTVNASSQMFNLYKNNFRRRPNGESYRTQNNSCR